MYEDFTFEVEVTRLHIEKDKLLSSTHSSATAHCKFRVTLRAGNELGEVKLQWNGLHRAKHPFDVVFVFPESNRQLWENADFLRVLSVYWKDLLGSGFAESSLCDDNEDKAQESDGQEDMEAEDGKEDGSSTLSNSAIRSCAVPVHRIVIAEDIPQHYEAFRAVLGWLRSTQIEFLALETTTSAADKPKEPTKQKKRRSRKSKSSRTSARPKTSPETASADPSDLPDESDEWSDSSEANDRLLSGKITAENVASELFLSFTEAYEEVHAS
ncbi:hypothetical protein MVLG_06462 [Microbotryum lychnidis-dioicae p1A1 Lamole]|uniref:Uncharacterized protein n=1 Tax=Microbotryum lychnidis-dioicae (strain p1A1 Lamole / MvSl-1064) TaxID=683840 RepID=U5HHC9_USTV1|nr:hypothetical protein MVLG_06462 [Microbotryum lychnidis-dioicae p1A1 Lamole]|eukprot:KDE03032.1 hypothetical protein MVLG_06462 [Microbotryum lychnidis-dioicae p1A1 Lamole]